ncbi:Hypothetical_protein [Hexamita inflata]|uniref:Hypothetical_protein n=1 Tax=Hexamita inflata TaxID=28002 RepID=A0AA86V0H9_9EUKA|nr:Hypothetical protein HINF_LOCUS63344 [Hexamita inflata]
MIWSCYFQRYQTIIKQLNPMIPRKAQYNPKRSQTSIQMKQAINSIHPSRQIRTKSYFHSRLPYRRRFKWNQECPTKQQQQKSSPKQRNVQITFLRKATPQNRKQDRQFMTLFPGQTLNKQEITHTQYHATPLLNQKLLSTKRSQQNNYKNYIFLIRYKVQCIMLNIMCIIKLYVWLVELVT